MSLAGFSVRNSVLVNILMISVLVIGTVQFIKLPRELMTNVSLNWALIVAPYPGASPKEIEQLVTIPIEDEIKDLEGVDFISSRSAEGYAVLDVKFEDMDEDAFRYAFQELRSRVDSVDDLPEDMERIEVNDFETSDVVPLINITVSGRLPERKLRRVAEMLEDEIREIKNVSRIQKMGMRDREIWVEVDPQRLYNYALTLPQVMQALAGKNLNMPGGRIQSGRSEFLVRTVGEIDAAEDLKRVILRQVPGGESVSLEDVALVSETFDSETGTISRMDGQPSITLTISKKSQGNSLIVIDAIKDILIRFGEKMHGEVVLSGDTGARGGTSGSSDADRSRSPLTLSLTEMPGVAAPASDREHFLRFTSTFDSSMFIKESLGVLENNAVYGLGLVLVLLYLFLGLRYAFMAALGMVISFLGAFILMSFTGRSLNANSLFGLVLVMGIVVDDAIVILENCYRYLQMGWKPRDAAIRGTDEVVAPVLSATLTTIAAFLPLMLLPGVMGEFMKAIPMVVCMALAASLVEAFIILPTHVAEWSGRVVPRQHSPLIHRFSRSYPRVLRVVLHFRYLFVTLGLIVCVASAALIPFLGVDMLQGESLPRFSVEVEMPNGTGLEVTDNVIRRIEAQASTLPREDVEAVVATTGLIQTNDEWILKSNVGQIMLELKEKQDRKHSIEELMDTLRKRIANVSGPKNVRIVKMLGGPPTGKPVAIKVKGDDMDTLRQVSGLFQGALRALPGVHDVGDDFSPGKQEIRVRLDEDKAALFGLSVAQVAQTVQAAYQGAEASVWRDGDEEVTIRVKLEERWRRYPEDLLRLKIGTPTGTQVPLGKIAGLEIEQGYAEIRRFKGERAITVVAEVDKKETSAVEVNTVIEKKAPAILAGYPGYRIDFEGEFKAFVETFNNLLQFFLIGVFLIYLILSGQFRSFVQPLIILFTLPFAFLGAMVGLLVLNAKFTAMTMYAIVALAGIAVNDAIVLISFINNARARGAGAYESVIEAGILRLRPIILTSVTTIVGLLPMAAGLGGESMSWQPLANTIIWGLLFATVLTLLIIPAVYTIVVDDIATPARRFLRFLFNLPEPEVPDPAGGLTP